MVPMIDTQGNAWKPEFQAKKRFQLILGHHGDAAGWLSLMARGCCVH
jgi:hypothetical protein